MTTYHIGILAGLCLAAFILLWIVAVMNRK